MASKTKLNHALLSLVSDFENMAEANNFSFLDEKNFYQLIHYYEEEYHIDKAIEVVDVALAQYDYRSDFYIIKAKLHMQLDESEEALLVLDQAEIISPFQNEILLLRARALSDLKNFEAANKVLEELKLHATSTELAEVYICESYIFECQKEFDKMYDCLKKALTFNNTNQEALERMWVSIELSKMFDDSIRFHKQLIDQTPYSYLAWYNMGHAYSCIGEYEKAIDAMEYAFITNESFEIAYLDCADLCVQTQQYKRALSIYEEANSNFGPESELLVFIAECHLKLKNLISAKANLFTALRIDPYNDEVYYFLGESYSMEKSWHSAINAYTKAISIEECREEYYSGLANAYLNIGNYELAKFNFMEAAQAAPEQAVYWFQYCCLLIKMKKFEEALTVIEEADEYTVSAELLYCKAVCLMFINRKKEALIVLDEALVDDFDLHKTLFEIDPQLRLDKDILSIINYYEGETKPS